MPIKRKVLRLCFAMDNAIWAVAHPLCRLVWTILHGVLGPCRVDGAATRGRLATDHRRIARVRLRDLGTACRRAEPEADSNGARRAVESGAGLPPGGLTATRTFREQSAASLPGMFAGDR